MINPYIRPPGESRFIEKPEPNTYYVLGMYCPLWTMDIKRYDTLNEIKEAVLKYPYLRKFDCALKFVNDKISKRFLYQSKCISLSIKRNLYM